MRLGFSLLYLRQNIKSYTTNELGLSWKIQQKNILPEFRSIECMRFSLVTLESYDNVGDNNVGEASSKAKKRKTSKNEDIEQIMGAIQDVALAMREGNSTLREGNLIFEDSEKNYDPKKQKS